MEQNNFERAINAVYLETGYALVPVVIKREDANGNILSAKVKQEVVQLSVGDRLAIAKTFDLELPDELQEYKDKLQDAIDKQQE